MAQNGSNSLKRSNVAMEDPIIPLAAAQPFETIPKSPKTAIRDASETLIEAIKRAEEVVRQPPLGSPKEANTRPKKSREFLKALNVFNRLTSTLSLRCCMGITRHVKSTIQISKESSLLLLMLITSSDTIVHHMPSEMIQMLISKKEENQMVVYSITGCMKRAMVVVVYQLLSRSFMALGLCLSGIGDEILEILAPQRGNMDGTAARTARPKKASGAGLLPWAMEEK